MSNPRHEQHDERQERIAELARELRLDKRIEELKAEVDLPCRTAAWPAARIFSRRRVAGLPMTLLPLKRLHTPPIPIAAPPLTLRPPGHPCRITGAR